MPRARRPKKVLDGRKGTKKLIFLTKIEFIDGRTTDGRKKFGRKFFRPKKFSAQKFFNLLAEKFFGRKFFRTKKIGGKARGQGTAAAEARHG